MEDISTLIQIQESVDIEIFEVSPYRSDVLKEMDSAFADLKKDPKNVEAKKAIITATKKFTDINSVVFTLKKGYFNAAVIPIYNQVFSTDIINLFKDYESDKNIRNLDVAEEPAKYIEKINIIVGVDLMKDLAPRELTAVILHELGHVYTHTSNAPRFIMHILSKILGFSSQVFGVPFWLAIMSVPAYLTALVVLVTLTRTLNFLDHKGEYRADQFAAKYGYGDEIVKVLYKFHKQAISEERRRSWWKKIIGFFQGIFYPAEHPKSSSRIEELSDQMLKDYKLMYPSLSKELNIILQDVKS